MAITKLREMAEKAGALISFVPATQPKYFFVPPGTGRIKIVPLAMSEDESGDWVRGWDFSLEDEDGKWVQTLYLDYSELSKISLLLNRWSDESVKMAFKYVSIEGIVMQKFESMQHVTFMTRGYGTRSGLRGITLVKDMFDYLTESSAGWER